jgi:excisionase family DNA binding protein
VSLTTNWPAKVALTIEEAQFAAGVSRRSLERAIESGALRSAFVCGRRRIAPADLEAFMAGSPMPSGAPAKINVRRFA